MLGSSCVRAKYVGDEPDLRALLRVFGRDVARKIGFVRFAETRRTRVPRYGEGDGLAIFIGSRVIKSEAHETYVAASAADLCTLTA